MCLVLLCVLRLTNFGFVQCLHLSSLRNFARVCCYVLRASPRKHRVCAVLFPRPILSLYACFCHVFVMRTLICRTNIGFVNCFSLGSLLKRLYAYLCHVMLCILRLTTISFVRCISLGSLLQFYSLQLQPCIGHVLLRVFFY